MEKIRNAKFQIGQVVKHRGFLGQAHALVVGDPGRWVVIADRPGEKALNASESDARELVGDVADLKLHHVEGLQARAAAPLAGWEDLQHFLK